jgi:hypothetical protein
MRLKIIAGNLIAVLLLGFAGYGIVRSQISAELTAANDARVGKDRDQLRRAFRLLAVEFEGYVADRAAQRDVREVFNALEDDARRTRAFESVERMSSWFGDPSRRGLPPDLIIITDETGKVIARNADRNRMFGTMLAAQLPALAQATQQGTAATSAWNKEDEGKYLLTSAAPIRSESGTILGGLVVAYDISNAVAKREAELLGGDVAFVVDDKVYSSSLEAGQANELKDFLFSEAQAGATRQALSGGADSAPWQATIGGNSYIGITTNLPGTGDVHVAAVVMRNRTAAVAPVAATNLILALTAVVALLVIAYGFGIGTSIIRPIEQVEEALLAIVNGRTDLRIDIEAGELGGLVYRINQLLNVFTGVQETSEDDQGRVSSPPDQAAWKDQAFSEASGGGGGGGSSGSGEPIDDPALAAKLEAEPEDAYLARVYKEYVAAMQAAGSSVAIPQEKFGQRLKGNAAALAQKHGCRMVRFQVETRGAQVILSPVLIR